MGSNHTCLAVISLDSALKKDKNYFSQMFLKESKYIEKRKLLAILLRTQKLLVAFLVKNNFFVKTNAQERFTRMKHLCSIDLSLYLYALDCKQFLLTALNLNCIAYQSFFLRFTKTVHFEQKNSQEKYSHSQRKILTTKENFSHKDKNSHGERNIVTSKEKFSHTERKIPTAK